MSAATLTDPDWLPDRIDPLRREVTGIATTADALRAASFLDGRSRFGEATSPVAFATLMSAAEALPDTPVPMIFHVSFCRSTLLSRLLDIPGATRVLREPRVQIDLADWRASGRHDADYQPLLRAITRLLGRSGRQGEQTVTKPTNWANVLLPDLLADPAAVRPAFITAQPRAFLRAVFRGGRERITFTMRAAQHFAAVLPGGPARVAAAITAGADPLDQAARLALLALGFQLDLFAPDPGRRIDEADIRADPIAAAVHVAALLGLTLSPAVIAEHARMVLARHAKAPDAVFRQQEEGSADALVERHHRERLDAALTWYARQPT